MSTLENVSQEDLKNPDYVPPLQVGLVLGLQHVLAMFVSNVTPSIITVSYTHLTLPTILLV